MSPGLFRALCRVAENRGVELKDLGKIAKKRWNNPFVKTLPDDCFDVLVGELEKKPVLINGKTKGLD